MTWALKRQIFYIVVLIVFISLLVFVALYPSLNKAPTCADGIENGTETGVDCGGSCARACLLQVDQISVLWSQTFQVVPGRYNALTYLENHNKNTAVYKIKYRFRFADANNVYIGKREGSTTIPPGMKFAVFEPAIDLGNSVPVYTTFEFTETPVWVSVPQDKIDQLKIFVSNIDLEQADTSPILSATISNSSLFSIRNINVIGIIYDKKGNAVSASRTFVDLLGGEGKKDVTFTWPEPIRGEVINKEIIPIFNIFDINLK
ncbi:MAG: hypothetical protein WC783_04165 [Candidatus Paceibacterota bacterium]|jgi:hypothetical protein